MIDKKHIGRVVSRHNVEIEKGRLRFFAKAIGETDPRWTGADGDACLPVPPTFLFCLEMDGPNPYAWHHDVGLDVPKLLHAEQSFTYVRPCYSGDVLTFEAHIEDIFDKKDGALEFVIKDTRVTNQNGEHVANLRCTLVQRNA